jgi:hypothetical protein
MKYQKKLRETLLELKAHQIITVKTYCYPVVLKTSQVHLFIHPCTAAEEIYKIKRFNKHVVNILLANVDEFYLLPQIFLSKIRLFLLLKMWFLDLGLP